MGSEAVRRGRIAFLIPMLGAGGAERVTIDIAHGLMSSCQAVDIVTNETVGEFVANVNQAIGLHTVASYSHPRIVIRLRRYFSNKKPDVVFAQGMRMSVSASLAMLLPGHKPKLVWCLHNPYSTKYKLYPKPLAWAITRFVAWMAKIPVKIVGVSDGVCKSFIDFIGPAQQAKMMTLHNPVPPYQGAAIDRSARKSPRKVIAVGRLEVQKNFPLLIRSIPLVLAQLPVTVSIYGQGPLKDKLQAQIDAAGLSGEIVLEGYAPDIRSRMANADLFVLSSSWEGLPTVLIEAMTTGVPVVSTNCTSGPDEILEGGKWGRLVPEDDENELAKAMLDVLRNGGVDPRPRARAFEPEHVIARYRALLNDLLG